MKRITLYISLFLIPFTLWATDTVYVKETQIPILIDREDNVLFNLRIEAKESQTLDKLVLRLGDETDWNTIHSLSLYYAGTEAWQREDSRYFAPVEYISRHAIGKTRKADPSYSILLEESEVSQKEIAFTCHKKLYPGINYFWVSIRMKPGTSLLTKVTATLASVVLDNQQAPLSLHAPEGITHRMGIGVRHAGDDGSASFRIPGLVTTTKGSLLGVYDVRYNNSADLQEHVDIGVSRSKDGGQTWKPMRLAMSFGENAGMPKAQNGVGDPAILVDRLTGRIWIIAAWTQGMGNGRAWFNSRQGMNHKTAQLMLAYSDDDGQSWSEPIHITDQVKDPSWHFLLQGPGKGITMQDGTLVFAAQYIDAEKVPNACIIYSKDRGQTWNLHHPARINTTEAQVVEIEPGLLMLNMRDNRGGSRAVSVTKDMGKTWTAHPSSRKTLQEPVCMASLIRSEAKDNSLGKDILLFSNPNTTQGRNHITIKASLDGGLTFPDEYQVLLDEEEGWGYSCLTMIDRETVGILYEGSTAHIVFQAIPLKDIVTGAYQ